MGNSCPIKAEHSLSTQHNCLCEGVYVCVWGGVGVVAAGWKWLE